MLELVIDNIPQLIHWKDKHLNYLGCNQNFAALTGIKNPINIVGKNDDDLLWIKEDLTKIQESERRVMANNKAEYHTIEFLVLLNGNKIWFEVNRIPLHNLDGEVVGILSTYRDITIRRVAEQKLIESEVKYRGILENIKESYFEVDLKGNFTFFNDALCDLQGIPRNELLGRNYEEFLDEKNKKEIFKDFNQVYETGISKSDVRYSFKKKTGEEAICESSIYLRYNSNGDKVGFSGVVRDITDKFRLEQKIKESEEKYRHLFESSPSAIWLMELDGTILDCNSTMNNLLSAYERKDLIGKKFSEVLSIIKRPEFLIHILKERWAKFVKGDKLGPLEFQITRADGKKFWLDIQSSLVKVGDKTLMQAIIQDITEKKIAEQNLKKSQEDLRILNRLLEQKVLERTLELRKSEQQYRTTINSLGDSLHVVDRDLRIILMNQAVKKWLIEFNIKTDIVGSKISEAFPFLPSIIYEEYQQVFDTGIPLITTETTILPEIDVITETRKFPIFAEGKVAQVITIIRDITERKKIEQKLIESERKLRDQNIELKKLDQIKNDFITMAAHELKTPLISISGYTDYILLKHKNALIPEIFEDLKIVQRNVKRLEILMDQLLDVLKIDKVDYNYKLKKKM